MTITPSMITLPLNNQDTFIRYKHIGFSLKYKNPACIAGFLYCFFCRVLYFFIIQ